ncbi:MAG: hypothetical protein HOP22_11355 [Nitrospiraceae bacterium]|nr:hypothetical protein [Nitrospiraceae bacterium]
MWMIWFFSFLLFASPSAVEPGFSEKYERGDNIFKQASRYAPDNLLNLVYELNPGIPFQLVAFDVCTS